MKWFNQEKRRIKGCLPEIVLISAIVLVLTYGFAQTWSQSSPDYDSLFSVNSSADGSKIMTLTSGMQVYFSTNHGAIWNTQNTTLPLSLSACSADGKKVVAVFAAHAPQHVIVSTNAGITWNTTGAPIGDWRSCASSTDGNKLVAAIYGGLIYTSTNGGSLWRTNTAPAKDWYGLASSADGTRLAAVAYNDTIYTSTNSGFNWAPTMAPVNSWFSIASSADGNHLVAAGAGGIYISSDAGGSWSPTGFGGNAVATSADGRIMIASTSTNFGGPGNIWTSTNYGINWTVSDAPTLDWLSVASSADGNELLAGEYAVWIYRATPAPALNLTAASTNLELSWLIASTNLVLQQSTDLFSWSNITNPPVLNLTNLQDQIGFSSSNSSGFYRLASP
jgi:hypothetical protein